MAEEKREPNYRELYLRAMTALIESQRIIDSAVSFCMDHVGTRYDDIPFVPASSRLD